MEKQTPENGRLKKTDGASDNTAVYVSEFSAQRLKGIQLKRVLLTAAALLCFAAAAVLPADLSDFYNTHRLLSGCYAAVVIFTAVTGIYVLYQSNRRHKLRVKIPKADAPPKGFSKRTYFSVEIFTALLLAVTIMQLALLTVAADIYAVFAAILIVISVFCGSVSWIVLLCANKNAVLEGGEPFPEQSAETPDKSVSAEQSPADADDFYNTQG